ncbi:MAG TPA: hypothetical protein VMW91_05200, partial [Desulfosporosinus sp.]|nr:hypothetical protein [Desulfosporosinus sp.]
MITRTNYATVARQPKDLKETAFIREQSIVSSPVSIRVDLFQEPNNDAIERISVDSNGVQGNDHSFGPAISSD